MELNFLFQEQLEAMTDFKKEQCLIEGYSEEEANLYAEAFAEGCIETRIEVILSLLDEHNISLPLAMEKLRINEEFTKNLLEAYLNERYMELPKSKKKVTMCDIYNAIENKGIQKGIQIERERYREARKRRRSAQKEHKRLVKLCKENNLPITD